MHLDLRGSAASLGYRLLTNLVVPRPIAWVTSMDISGGINLAPFSFFNLMGAEPSLVVIGVGNAPDGTPKHTARNIAATREFVVNLVTEDLAAAMNLTSANFPEGHSELEAAGLTAGKSITIKVPRVAEARAALECVVYKIERIGANNLIIGEVLALHTTDDLIDPNLQVQHFAPIARMGGRGTYARTEDRFELPRPTYVAPAETEGDN